ncbi:Hint domain-containing protein [Prevotella sp. 10(H)]|uniref:Hint domain-containing protein n=1 Tax=Prevotella sp. 10(H) TaxID=1158294 RepID=UPI0004A72B61|nr:Hint domain-containing protein [Prevotella sp. 10(H)]
MKIRVFLFTLTCFFVLGMGINAQNSSLAAGTKITMFDDKKKNIEELEVGDVVLAFNIKEKVYEEKKVGNINKIMYNRLVRVSLESGMQLTMTIDTPIWAEKGWVSVDPELTKMGNKFPDVQTCKIGEYAFYYNITSTDYVEITVIQGIMEPTQTYTIELEGGGALIANGFIVGLN